MSSSSPIGCGILLSASLWHWREGWTQVPRRCNYITISLAAQRSLTQLFLQNIILLCHLKECDLWVKTRARLRVVDQCTMHACVGECITSQEWLWQTEEFLAERFPFMVCLKHVNDHPGRSSLCWYLLRWLVADSKHQACFFFTYLIFTPILTRNSRQRHKTLIENLHACSRCLFSARIDGFLRLLWASHVCQALSWSMHGHISSDALWRPGMLCLRGSRFS